MISLEPVGRITDAGSLGEHFVGCSARARAREHFLLGSQDCVKIAERAFEGVGRAGTRRGLGTVTEDPVLQAAGFTLTTLRSAVLAARRRGSRVASGTGLILLTTGTSLILLTAGTSLILLTAGTALILLTAGTSLILLSAGTSLGLLTAGTSLILLTLSAGLTLLTVSAGLTLLPIGPGPSLLPVSASLTLLTVSAGLTGRALRTRRRWNRTLRTRLSARGRTLPTRRRTLPTRRRRLTTWRRA